MCTHTFLLCCQRGVSQLHSELGTGMSGNSVQIGRQCLLTGTAAIGTKCGTGQNRAAAARVETERGRVWCATLDEPAPYAPRVQLLSIKRRPLSVTLTLFLWRGRERLLRQFSWPHTARRACGPHSRRSRVVVLGVADSPMDRPALVRPLQMFDDLRVESGTPLPTLPRPPFSLMVQ